MGAYACGAEEAVILEVAPPVARYWSLSLATWFWESADIADRQCSINHAQAEIDDDGAVRVVIAQHDPGVANWLDPAGYERGSLAVRYLDARVDPDDHLPDRVPRPPRRSAAVVHPDGEPAERTDRIRARRAALVRRYRR